MRRSDNASLARFTFSRSPFHWGQNIGNQNCAYLVLLIYLAWKLLDICETITLLRRKWNDGKTETCTSRDAAWPIESDLFEYRYKNQLECRTSSSCELIDQTQTLHLHIPLWFWPGYQSDCQLQRAPTVSFHLPFLWTADGETCKTARFKFKLT